MFLCTNEFRFLRLIPLLILAIFLNLSILNARAEAAENVLQLPEIKERILQLIKEKKVVDGPFGTSFGGNGFETECDDPGFYSSSIDVEKEFLLIFNVITDLLVKHEDLYKVAYESNYDGPLKVIKSGMFSRFQTPDSKSVFNELSRISMLTFKAERYKKWLPQIKKTHTAELAEAVEEFGSFMERNFVSLRCPRGHQEYQKRMNGLLDISGFSINYIGMKDGNRISPISVVVSGSSEKSLSEWKELDKRLGEIYGKPTKNDRDSKFWLTDDGVYISLRDWYNARNCNYSCYNYRLEYTYFPKFFVSYSKALKLHLQVLEAAIKETNVDSLKIKNRLKKSDL